MGEFEDLMLDRLARQNEMDTVRKISAILALPWPDEMVDVRECFRIAHSDAPDGNIGSLIELERDARGEICAVTLNATICKMARYFKSKYNDSSLFNRFLYQYIFEPGMVAGNRAN